MPALSIKALLADAADDVVRWAERQFANLADTPANRRAVQRAVRERAAGSGVRRPRAQLPSQQADPFAVPVERARRQTAREERPTTRLRGAPADMMVAPRVPSEGRNRTGTPNRDMYGDPTQEYLTQSRDAMLFNVPAYKRNMEGVTQLPFMQDMQGQPLDRIYDTAVERGRDNLLWIANTMPRERVEEAAQWYPTANRLGTQFAEVAGLPPQAGHGALAALSPQMDWNYNVAQVDRLMQMLPDEFAVDPAGLQAFYARRNPNATPLAFMRRSEADRQRMAETPFWELDDVERPLRVVMAERSRFPDYVREALPDGSFGDPYGAMRWGSGNEINNALSIVADPSIENIRNTLDAGGKVSSFFNDISVPYHGTPSMTTDTHSGNALTLTPTGGSHDYTSAWMGRGRLVTSPEATGSLGLYPISVEAHQQAARELGLDRANAAQSATWVGIRDLIHGPDKRRMLPLVEAIYARNAGNPAAARREIGELLGVDAPISFSVSR